MSSKRWMAEITYRDQTKPLFIEFEEIADLHDIVEMGPNWIFIEQIVITLNPILHPDARHDEIATRN